MARTRRALTAVGLGAGVAALLRDERWRRRLERAADGVRRAVGPDARGSGRVEPVGRPPTGAEDEAHAPRHRHLAAPAEQGVATGPDDRHTGVDHTGGHVRKG